MGMQTGSVWYFWLESFAKKTLNRVIGTVGANKDEITFDI